MVSAYNIDQDYLNLVSLSHRILTLINYLVCSGTKPPLDEIKILDYKHYQKQSHE